MASVMNGVKPEDPLQVKDEPNDAGTPMSGISEDVEEEDTGELSMPKSDYPGIFLTRAPKDLWQGLLDAEASLDEPISIGTIKVWQRSNGTQDMRLNMKHDVPTLQTVPKDYEFSIVNMEPPNTFVFTEKDLPGYKPGMNNFRASQKTDRIQKNRKPLGRRAIPKRTSLVGFARHEFSLVPLENQEYERVQRLKEQNLAASEVNLQDMIESESRRTDVVGSRDWNSFTRADRRPKEKKQLNKAERIPQNLLIDKLVECFTQFKYWHFRSLVATVAQPESYVRETLQKIAMLVRSGDMANTWTLAPQYRDTMDIQEAINSGAAPEIEEPKEEDDVKDEGDSDDGPMENVL